MRLDDSGYKKIQFADSWPGQRRALLQEIDALRAELAGAEERGRQAILSYLDAWERDHNPALDANTTMRDAIAFVREELDHVRTGAAAPDGGDSGV